MPVEVEAHTVPHFKAAVNSKVEPRQLEWGNVFKVMHSLSKLGLLLHKMGFVKTAVPMTVIRTLCSSTQLLSCT